MLVPGYSISPDSIVTMDKQRDFCQQQGGELIHNFNSSSNIAAAFSLASFHPSYIWYGARDSTPDGSKQFRDIVDGTLALNLPFSTGELQFNNERCLIYKSDGLFHDCVCDWGVTSATINGFCQGKFHVSYSITEGVCSLFSKTRSSPCCYVVLIDPRMTQL